MEQAESADPVRAAKWVLYISFSTTPLALAMKVSAMRTGEAVLDISAPRSSFPLIEIGGGEGSSERRPQGTANKVLRGKGKKKGNFNKNIKQVAAQEKKPKSGPKPETECFYCKQTGHWKRNCPKYLADKKDGKVNKVSFVFKKLYRPVGVNRMNDPCDTIASQAASTARPMVKEAAEISTDEESDGASNPCQVTKVYKEKEHRRRHTGDPGGDHKPEEEDEWHNADDGEPFETKAAADEPEPEFADRATTRQDSLRVHQHLKLLLSQLSASSSSFRTPDSPSVQEQQHEQAVLRNITRALSLQRNYSGVSDGSVVDTEAEECGTVDELRRRVELDRRSMALLWKELEEERSASAVATSQAMAMITRLQEEKAAMRTEAAQYRRVMEEQSAGLTDRLHRLSNNSSGIVQEPEPTDVEEEEEDGDGGKEEDTTEPSVVGRRVRNGDNFTKWQHLQSIETTNKGSTHGHGHHGHDGGGEGDDTAALEEEIGELSRRLQALEADRSFLEHSVNSLRNGRDGEAVIHDIARSLRELRKTLGEDAIAS
ncbi:hypothetical protein TRIUR3_30595 [Triticum urartu]|uniref:CCHC-type domain-containing protein n=1 Tax=Triticum urartu TaxID=4572 RepID=M7Z017_TRIUA|nr:hypothetical protein TRIUR3_30595 [Triticum urartu]